jgi:ketosteroid isomerase-like protein
MAQANRTVIEDYYRAMGQGDFDHVVSLHAPDLVCWMSGRSLVSGRFQGRTELYAHMGRHVLGALVTGTEPYVKDNRIAVVDGDFVLGLLHGGLPGIQPDSRYDQFYFQLFRLEQGLIVEIVEIFDTVMVETVLMGRKLATPRAWPAAPFDLAAPALQGRSRGDTTRLARELGQALAADQAERVAALLSREPIVRLIGTTPSSGRWNCIDPVYPVLAGGMRDVRTVCADESAACLLMRSANPYYQQQLGILIGIQDDRIGELTIFADTLEAEQVVFGNRILPDASERVMPPFDVATAFGGSRE